MFSELKVLAEINNQLSEISNLLTFPIFLLDKVGIMQPLLSINWDECTRCPFQSATLSSSYQRHYCENMKKHLPKVIERKEPYTTQCGGGGMLILKPIMIQGQMFGILGAALVQSVVVNKVTEMFNRQINNVIKHFTLEIVSVEYNWLNKAIKLIEQSSSAFKDLKNFDITLNAVLLNTINALNATAGAFTILNIKENSFQINAVSGISKQGVHDFWTNLERGLFTKILKSNSPIYSNEMLKIGKFILSTARIDSNNILLIEIHNKKDGSNFSDSDVSFLKIICSQLNIYLNNREERQNSEDILLSSINAVATAIDNRIPFRVGHSERVALYSFLIANEIEKSDISLVDIKLTGLLHDIGYIGLSDVLLLKPGNFTTEERKIIQKHPLIGAKILESVLELENVIFGIRHHHERYDGTGYPSGLKGPEIPLLARIIAVSDAYDAMISERPYKRRMAPAEAQMEISNKLGIQFDPNVGRALIKAFEKGATISDSIANIEVQSLAQIAKELMDSVHQDVKPAILTHELREEFPKTLEATPNSAVIIKLLDLMEDPQTSAEEIAYTISLDPVLCLKILQLSNSSNKGFPKRINTIEQALLLLGVGVIHSLLFGIKLTKFPEKTEIPDEFEKQTFFEHYLTTAMAAKFITLQFNLSSLTMAAYMGGLLHDMGKRFLKQNYPGDYKKIFELVSETGISFLEAEKRVLDKQEHATFGGKVFAIWELPPSLVDAVAYHHDPLNKACKKMGKIIYMANILSHIYLKNKGINLSKEKVDVLMFSLLQAVDDTIILSESKIKDILDKITKERAQIKFV